MLETLDLGAQLDRDEYEQCKSAMQVELNQMQRRARQMGLGVIVVVEGWDFSGKSRLIQFLADPLDPRGFEVHAMYPPTQQEGQYPFARRYLIRMPPHGKIAFFLRSWYYHVLDERVNGGESALESSVALDAIRRQEKSLADDGYLLVKFWLHIDQAEQRKRRRKHKTGSSQRWHSGPDDPRQHKRWSPYTRAAEDMLAATSTDFARWYPLPANSHRYACVAAATKLINRTKDAIELAERAAAQGPVELAGDRMPAVHQSGGMLAKADLSSQLEEPMYDRRLAKARAALVDLQYECVERGRAVLFLFEGWDAAGKGGLIRRLTQRLDPRYYAVHSIAAPQGEEAHHHYLWRFWRRVPPAGHWSIFDRSWYGRVLVERVEGFATIPQWRRAYSEINDFEAALADHGCILLKFWLHISQEEQLRRFQERQEIEYKQFKLTDDDWRNREKWPLYESAAEDIFQRTSTPIAPWHVVPANDKRFARVSILETCVKAIRKGLARKSSSLRRSFGRSSVPAP